MKSIACLCLVGLAVCFFAAIETNAQDGQSQNRRKNQNTKRPNILLILADDVGTGDIPYYWKNSSLVAMPNIDRLSEKGVTFMDAHSTPLCAPSRYMLLSGNYAHRGVLPKGSWTLNERGKNQFMPGQTSIAQVLRDEAGYSTAMFGKWHLGGGMHRSVKEINTTHYLTAPTHDWTQGLIDGPNDIGFDTSVMTVGGIQQDPYVFFKDGFLTIDPADAIYWKSGRYQLPNGVSKINRGAKFEGEGAVDWDSTTFNMILVNETTTFIENHLETKADDPFFAYVALGAVHTPHSPPYHYLDGSNVSYVYDTRHMDLLGEMDKVVGSLVSLIENKNIAEDTIIIFASDNGGLAGKQGTNPNLYGHASSGPLRSSKASIYEGKY